MKLYLSVDMEGMAGITHPSQAQNDPVGFRAALHRQIAWIVEGIQKSTRNKEITEITISDSHGGGMNLSYSALSEMDGRISMVSGSPRRQFMMAGLDESYALVFFAGYHAGAGQINGCMEHCFSSRVVHDLRINGRYMNESTTNAAYAGELGIPVGLVVGDSGLYSQLIEQKMMPWVEFVTTKDSLGRHAVKYRPCEDIHQDTVEKVARVLDGDYGKIPLYRMDAPYILQIEFHTTPMAEMVAQIPNTARLDARTVAIECKDLKTLECGISALTALAATAE